MARGVNNHLRKFPTKFAAFLAQMIIDTTCMARRAALAASSSCGERPAAGVVLSSPKRGAGDVGGVIRGHVAHQSTDDGNSVPGTPGGESRGQRQFHQSASQSLTELG